MQPTLKYFSSGPHRAVGRQLYVCCISIDHVRNHNLYRLFVPHHHVISTPVIAAHGLQLVPPQTRTVMYTDGAKGTLSRLTIIRQMDQECIGTKKFYIINHKGVSQQSAIYWLIARPSHPTNNQRKSRQCLSVTPTAARWYPWWSGIHSANSSANFHFRFFNGVSSAFFSPAGATGAFSLTFLSSGVGASVFFEGCTDATGRL